MQPTKSPRPSRTTARAIRVFMAAHAPRHFARRLREDRGETNPLLIIGAMIVLILCSTGVTTFYANSMLATAAATRNAGVTSAMEARIAAFEQTPWSNLAPAGAHAVTIAHGGVSYPAIERITRSVDTQSYRIDIASARSTPNRPASTCPASALDAPNSDCLALSGTVSATSEDATPPTPLGVTVNPGLGANPVINLAPDPSFDASGAPAVLLTNVITDPRANAAAGVVLQGDAAAALSQADGWGPFTSSHRLTLGSAAVVFGPTIPSGLAPSTTYGVRIKVRASANIPSGSFVMRATKGSVLVNQPLTIPAGESEIVTTFTTSSSFGTSSSNMVGVRTGGSSSVAGQTIDITGLLVVALPAGATDVPAYFDGATAAAGGAVYAWTGPADASTSTMSVVTPAVPIGPGQGPSTLAWIATGAAADGAHSLAVQSATAAAGETLPVLLPVTGGQAYTAVIATRGAATAQGLEVRDAAGAVVLAPATAAWPSALDAWTAERIRFTAPAGATQVELVLPASAGSPRFYDLLTLVADTAVGNGSRTNLAKNPSLATNTTSWAASSMPTAAGAIGRAAITDLPGFGWAYGGGGAGSGSMSSSARIYQSVGGLTVGQSYAFGIWTKASAASGSGSFALRSSSASDSNTNSTVFAIWKGAGAGSTTEWTWRTGVFVATAATMYIHVRNTGSLTDGQLWATGLIVELVPLTATGPGPFFDGSSPNTPLATHAWTGTPNASTSTEVGRVMAAYDGPPFAGTAIATFDTALLRPGVNAYRVSFRWNGTSSAPADLVATMTCSTDGAGMALSTAPVVASAGASGSIWMWARLTLPDQSRLRDCASTTLRIATAGGAVPAPTSFADASVLAVLDGITPPGGGS